MVLLLLLLSVQAIQGKYFLVETKDDLKSANTTSAVRERPLNIAHRGYSGLYPEHSIKAYEAGVKAGADYIECDVQFTADLVPVCLHDYWLSETTDVAKRAEFEMLKKPRLDLEDEGNSTDWLIWDLSLNQTKSVRLKERRATRSKLYDGLFSIPTLQEYLDVARAGNVGVYIEMKTPGLYNKRWRKSRYNQTAESILLEVLQKNGMDKKESADVILQSFEMRSLMNLSKMTRLRLVFLSGKDEHLENIHCFKEFLYGVGIWKNQSVPLYGSQLGGPTGLVESLQALNLKVHVYTFRNDDLPSYSYLEDPTMELERFYDLGVDGFFTDYPATLSRFLNCKHP